MMNFATKLSIWLVILVLVGGQVNDLLQSMLVEAGFLQKPISIKDVCKFETLPPWFKDLAGCRKEDEKTSHKPKLNLGGDLLQKFKFETREKTVSEKLSDQINKLFVSAQRLVLPEKYVMPCLLGDCNMDKKIKEEKKDYSNLLRKQVPLTPPDKRTIKPDESKPTPDLKAPNPPS